MNPLSPSPMGGASEFQPEKDIVERNGRFETTHEFKTSDGGTKTMRIWVPSAGVSDMQEARARLNNIMEKVTIVMQNQNRGHTLGDKYSAVEFTQGAMRLTYSNQFIQRNPGKLENFNKGMKVTQENGRWVKTISFSQDVMTNYSLKDKPQNEQKLSMIYALAVQGRKPKQIYGQMPSEEGGARSESLAPESNVNNSNWSAASSYSQYSSKDNGSTAVNADNYTKMGLSDNEVPIYRNPDIENDKTYSSYGLLKPGSSDSDTDPLEMDIEGADQGSNVDPTDLNRPNTEEVDRELVDEGEDTRVDHNKLDNTNVGPDGEIYKSLNG